MGWEATWNRGQVRTFFGCTFPFSVAGVPKASIYTVTISHRVVQTYSYADFQRENWDIEVNLGAGLVNPSGHD